MIGGNPISVKTLDLNQEFSFIAAQLDKIAEDYFGVQQSAIQNFFMNFISASCNLFIQINESIFILSASAFREKNAKQIFSLQFHILKMLQ